MGAVFFTFLILGDSGAGMEVFPVVSGHPQPEAHFDGAESAAAQPDLRAVAAVRSGSRPVPGFSPNRSAGSSGLAQPFGVVHLLAASPATAERQPRQIGERQLTPSAASRGPPRLSQQDFPFRSSRTLDPRGTFAPRTCNLRLLIGV